LQTLTEYLLGLTPIQFNKNDKLNETQNANFKSADGKIIAQDKTQDGNSSSEIANEKNSENSKDGQNYNENNPNGEDNPIKQAEENVKTEVVSNNVNPRYNYDYNGIKIYNSTKYKLTNEMLDISNFSVNKDKILIYHTHTCESYTPTEKYNYQQTGNFRTTDLNFSVVRVGEELKKQLESYNIKVIQNKTYHDYPSYNGSYSRSLTTANNMLNENKDADIVIDLHRDAITDSSYAPKVKIGDEYVSQMMFVIGTDIANPANSHWNENLKFAVKVQQKANEMYPRII
jgi:stage II sporulation protein P